MLSKHGAAILAKMFDSYRTSYNWENASPADIEKSFLTSIFEELPIDMSYEEFYKMMDKEE